MRRKALFVRASERRAQAIEARRLRLEKKEEDLLREEEKFAEDHKEEIEAFRRFEQQELEKKEDEYGDENGDDEEPREKPPAEKPVLPVFNREEHLLKWEEENPEPALPPEAFPDTDNDWVLSEEEEEQALQAYFAAKDQQA